DVSCQPATFRWLSEWGPVVSAWPNGYTDPVTPSGKGASLVRREPQDDFVGPRLPHSGCPAHARASPLPGRSSREPNPDACRGSIKRQRFTDRPPLMLNNLAARRRLSL